METMRELRSKSLRKVLPISILLIVGSVAIFFFYGCYKLPQVLAPKTLTDLPVEELENTFVQADIDYLYDYYMYSEQTRNNVSTGTITSMEYLIDCGDYYMGLRVPQSLVKDTRAMLKRCQQGDISSVFKVRGMVMPMEGTRLRYYKEALNYDEMPASQQEKFLLLYIDVDQVGGHNVNVVWALLAVSVALLAWGIVRLVKASGGGYQKALRRKLASMGDPTQMEERFDQFYQSREPVSGLRMDDEFFLVETGAKQELMRPWEVAWAYQCTTNHYRGVIKTGTSYALRLRLMNGKQRDISMGQSEVQAALQAMGQAMPGVVLGYSKEVEASYRQNRDAFRQRWEAAHPGCTARS